MASIEERLEKLFSELVEFRQEFTKLDKEAENLNEIAMNAAVTAGQTGKHIRIYTEISNQIASSAKKMTKIVEKNREEANSILNIILKIMSSNSLTKNFSKSNQFIQNKINIDFMKLKISSIKEEWKHYIRSINNHVYPAKSNLKSILQIQYKLFGIYSCLMIESINLDKYQYTSISNLGRNLSQSYEKSILTLQKLITILKRIAQLISHLYS